MIASLNDVAAFMTPEKKPLLVGDDSCSKCITSGHTYVFNQQKNDAPYFESFAPGGEAFPDGQCCDTTDGNVDCVTSHPAKRDLLWETLAYKGVAAGDEACKLIPRLQEISFKIYASSPNRSEPKDAFLWIYIKHLESGNLLDYQGDGNDDYQCFSVI